MKVVLDHRLFQSEDSGRFNDLTELLLAANRSPHRLVIGGGEQGRSDWARWLAGHHEGLQRSFEATLNRGRSPKFVRKPPAITLWVSDEVDEEIDEGGKEASAHSFRARELVAAPLKLWLENDRNDSAFLRTVAPAGDYRSWLERAKDRGWIEFRHGGGSDLQKKLEGLGPWERLRSWAMCDLDSWEPGKCSSQVEKLQEISESRPAKGAAPSCPTLPLHVLRRRAIENYLPTRALRRWAAVRQRNNHEQRRRQQAFADAVANLDTHEATFNLRHHYHMERGFRAEPEKIPSAYAPFRDDPILMQGIGTPIKDVYRRNLDVRERGGHDWFEDAWFAEDSGLREEMVGLIESIRSRI